MFSSGCRVRLSAKQWSRGKPGQAHAASSARSDGSALPARGSQIPAATSFSKRMTNHDPHSCCAFCLFLGNGDVKSARLAGCRVPDGVRTWSPQPSARRVVHPLCALGHTQRGSCLQREPGVSFTPDFQPEGNLSESWEQKIMIQKITNGNHFCNFRENICYYKCYNEQVKN